MNHLLPLLAFRWRDNEAAGLFDRTGSPVVQATLRFTFNVAIG